MINSEEDYIYDKLLSMKIFKVVALVLVTVFLLSAVGLCEPPSASCCDDDQQCDSSCNLACCSDALLPVMLMHEPSLVSSQSFSLSRIPHQEPFVSGIEYPPNF